MMKGLVFGLVGGVLGAIIWAAIIYYTGYEVGYVAIGVGLLVGFGVGIGAQESAGLETGMIAAVIALGAICLGKWTAVEILVQQGLGSSAQYVQQEVEHLQTDDEYVVTYIADTVVEEYVVSDREVNWPSNPEESDLSSAADYPSDVWQEAESRWDGMTSGERDIYRQELIINTQINTRDYIDAMYDEIRADAFRESFGGLDILFFALGGFAAFKVGAGMTGE